MASGKILVAQGGGPTAVINQSLVGVALEARRFGNVERIYGACHGVRGIVDEDFVDLTQETSHNLELVARTPSSALGSTRDKPDLRYCQEIFKVLRAHEIEHFFYIGGNDSSDTVRIVSEEAHHAGYPLRCIHIPKTIDNDLVGSDHTPGYPSAARFVALAFAGANLDNAALPGVYVGVVMGRHAGFLTAASALGKKFPDDGPHLIYLPERTFVLERFLADVKATMERYGRCVVAVSEGIHDASGAPIVAQLSKCLEHDAHGNVQTGYPAGAGRHLWLPAALVHRLCVGCRPARSPRGGRKSGAVRHVGRHGRLGGYQAHRLLFGRLRTAATQCSGGQNPCDGRRIHHPLWHRRDRCLSHVFATLAGLRHARCIAPAAQPGGQGA
jgi:6-phosphofructokinase